MSASNIISPANNKIFNRYLPNPYPYPAFPSPLGAVLIAGNQAGDQDIVGVDNLQVTKVDNPLLGGSLTIGGAGQDLRITGATTKGSVLAGNGTSTVELPLGTTGYVLKANPATATGLEWAIDISGVTGVVGVNAGANIDISGTVSQPIVSVQNPLTSTLNLGLQNMTAGDPTNPLTFNSTTNGSGVIYNEGAILSANYSANSMSIVNTTGIGNLQATSGSITLADTSVGTSTVSNLIEPAQIRVISLDNIGGGFNRSTLINSSLTIDSDDATVPVVQKSSVYGNCLTSESAVDTSTNESVVHTITTNANGITESQVVVGGGTTITGSGTVTTTSAGFSRQWGDVTGNQTNIGTTQNGVSVSSSNGVLSTISGTLTNISTQIASDTTSARESVSYSQLSPAGLNTYVQTTADNTKGKTRCVYFPTPSGPLTIVDNEAGAGGCVLRHSATAVVTDITTSSPFGTIMSGSDAITVQSVGNLNLNSTTGGAGMSGQSVTIQSASSVLQLTSPASNIQYSSSTGQQVLVSSANSVSTPTYTITNTNASTASYPAVKLDRPTPASVAGDTIGAISMWADDGAGTTREWSRIQTKTENVSGGNQDATLSIFNSVNGVVLETFNFNGGQNENNSFRPLDMNGNNIRTTTGDMAINVASSSTAGAVLTLATKDATAGSGAGLALTGNTLLSPTSGGNAGQHLCLTIGGTVYKIALLNP